MMNSAKQHAPGDAAYDGITVVEAELAAASGDGSTCPQLEPLVPVLQRLRSAFGMEMIFVGQLHEGVLSGRPPGPDEACDPLEEHYGRGLLQARCGSAAYAAACVTREDGIAAGTLVCGVSANDGSEGPPDSLKSVSRLLAGSMRRLQRPARAAA
jgi:hypothetical protein